jgi:hypothetical protein
MDKDTWEAIKYYIDRRIEELIEQAFGRDSSFEYTSRVEAVAVVEKLLSERK